MGLLGKTMIKMNTYALVATSFVAVFSGTGCSTNLQKPTTDDADTVTVKKAAYHSNDDSDVFVQKATYRKAAKQTAKAQIDQDFDTWERVFKGFQLESHADNPRVQHFVTYYGKNPEQLTLLSGRASLFLHMIVHEVDRRKLPTELALLPFVESAFDPDIFSHAGAAGLWQFIPDTGRRYGLEQSKTYDARMDPFAATGAALNYLEKLSGDFNGDWLLALAAYNCGEGRVQREIALNQSKGLPTDFWNLDLPKETREYVPRLLAFKELISHADRYGIALADTPNRARLAQVRINKAVDLRQAAVQAGLAEDHLVNLNPYFRTGVTTPEYSNRIILPREYAATLAKIIESLPTVDDSPRLMQASYTPRANNSKHRYNRLATVRTGKRTAKETQYVKLKTKLRTAQRNDRKVNT